jgi:hypothetical protein
MYAASGTIDTQLEFSPVQHSISADESKISLQSATVVYVM